MNLPGYHVEDAAGQARADQPDRRGHQAGQAADHLRRRRHHQRRRQRRAARARQEDRHPRDDDRHGPRRVSQRRPAVARHARHARHASTPTTPSNEADLLLALGVRFDDRVTGKVEEFAKHGKIVHVDIDASEINKNKPAHIPIVQRREVRPRRAEQDRRGARRHLATGSTSARRGRSDEPFKYDENVHRHPAAARHRTSCGS